MHVHSGERSYEESLKDAAGLFDLSDEDLENDDILRPDDLCIFKININMGKKDKSVSLSNNASDIIHNVYMVRTPC